MKINKSNQVKTTIFSVIGLFSLTLLCQVSVSGQIPPRTTAPVRPIRQPTPTPPPTRAPANPSRQSFPNATKILPDLQITEMKHDKSDCILYIRVANKSSADAGGFNVWVLFSYPHPSQLKSLETYQQEARQIGGLGG